MVTDTKELLTSFVRDGSESAFRELVTRYIDLVYSTAVRLVDGDTYRAQDVAQIVFTDLARMARKIPADVMLGGWLHRHTCFVARTMMRGERRRQTREQQAAEINMLNGRSDSVLMEIAPILDEAIDELGPDDRDAILLRFFEGRNLRSVGEDLGVTENAAQKRVARALQELATLLQRRGVALSAVVLASGLAAGAVTAAPPRLALSLAGTVAASTGTTGGTLSFAKVATITKFKIGIVGGIIGAGILLTVFLHQFGAEQRNSPTPLPQQLTPRAESVQNPDPGGAEAVRSAVNDKLGNKAIASLQKPQSPLTDSQPTLAAEPNSLVVRQSSLSHSWAPMFRFVAKPGRIRLRIEGTSNIHSWQAETSIVGGFLETGLGFPLAAGLMLPPGPVQARVGINIPVRALFSVDGDGKKYSDKMDELMWDSLKSEQNPRIYYRSEDISFKGTTNYNGVPHYEFESRGQLTVAEATNIITMPVFVLPLASGMLEISGDATVKMSSFQIDPPAVKLALGSIKVGDEVNISFDWFVGPRTNAIQETVGAPGLSSASATPEVIPAEAIKFINTDLRQVLAIYGELAGAQLDLDERLNSLPVLIRFTNTESMTHEEAIRLLESALFEQAGIEAIHTQANRVVMRLRR